MTNATKFRWGFFLCIVLSLISQVPAVEYDFREKPLTSVGPITLRFFQDSDGFMWFATEQGVYRYNGYEVTGYNYNPSDTASLSSGVISNFFEDSQKNLWVLTSRGGLSRINLYTNMITRFQYRSSDSLTLNSSTVVRMVEGDDGTLFALTKTGINRYVLPDSHLTRDHFHQMGFDAVQGTLDIGALPDGLLTGGQLFTLNQTTYLFDPRYNQFWTIQTDHQITSAENGELLLGTQSKSDDEKIFWYINDSLLLTRVNLKSGVANTVNLQQISSSLNPENIRRLRITGRDDIWITTRGDGLLHFNWEAQELSRYYNDNSPQPSLPGNLVYDFFEDRSGNMWVSTENGIAVAKNREVGFHNRKPFNNGLNRHNGNRISGIFEDSTGKLWLSAYEQMHWYYPEKDTFVINIGEQIFPASLQSSVMKKMLLDSGRIWFCPKSKPVHLYDPKHKRFTQYPFPEENTHTLVRDIAPAENGLWFGVDFPDGGLYYFDQRGKKFTQYYKYNPDDTLSLSGNQVTSLHIDGSDRFWIGTWGSGLNLFNQEAEEFTRFRHNPNDSTSLSDNYITDIAEDTAGQLWITTWNGGVHRLVDTYSTDNKYAEERYHFRRFTTEDGLPGPQFLNILPADNGNIWFSTGYGLCRYNAATQSFRTFTTADGLASQAFILGAAHHASDGRFYFGTTDGVIFFQPDSIRIEARNPPIKLTTLEVLNEPYPLDTLLHHKAAIEFTYKENFISLEFAALEFNDPGNIKYQYQLTGIDEDWVNAGTRRYANYTHLPPGDYTFRVRYQNKNSKWSARQARLGITITPPYWMTGWFRLGAALVIIGIIVGGVWTVSRFRLKRRIRRLEMQQQLQSERERISRELHDHVGAKLTNMVTGLEIVNLHTKKGKKESVLERIEHLESHARSTINDLRQTIWSLKYDASSVSLLVEQIQEFIHEQLQVQEGVKIRCDYDEYQDMQLSPMQALNLFRITQEAVMNAVKYASANRITVMVDSSERNLLRIHIRDDGEGFDVAMEKQTGEGFGLESMAQRAEKIQADLHILSEPGTGTTVSVLLQFETDEQGP